jgi:hypothetical protein
MLKLARMRGRPLFGAREHPGCGAVTVPVAILNPGPKQHVSSQRLALADNACIRRNPTWEC